MHMRKESAVPPVFDRRRTPRHPVRHVGVIQTNPTTPRQYCMVTDESKGGVRIIYSAANLEPSTEFTLWLFEEASAARFDRSRGSRRA